MRVHCFISSQYRLVRGEICECCHVTSGARPTLAKTVTNNTEADFLFFFSTDMKLSEQYNFIKIQFKFKSQDTNF